MMKKILVIFGLLTASACYKDPDCTYNGHQLYRNKVTGGCYYYDPADTVYYDRIYVDRKKCKC